MFDSKSEACCRVSEYVRQHLPRSLVFDTVVPRTSAASEAFAAGQPVVLRSPADPAAQAYVNLATVLAERFE
jgi:chromosome partitioning protein